MNLKNYLYNLICYFDFVGYMKKMKLDKFRKYLEVYIAE